MRGLLVKSVSWEYMHASCVSESKGYDPVVWHQVVVLSYEGNLEMTLTGEGEDGHNLGSLAEDLERSGCQWRRRRDWRNWCYDDGCWDLELMNPWGWRSNHRLHSEKHKTLTCFYFLVNAISLTHLMVVIKELNFTFEDIISN